ncbi:hypothetical protein PPIS_a2588 [Pseudoalteromonas piscicida]|uniref:Uncharacterized protein n=1 Tax=Pseudoalteromonas piscicida TaxID=43662 RepID=A0ABN5CGQ1_PSEO7|nr:hypothetical protein PPIS_a2588 [Pseudoalteromonas piscicida]
MPNSANTNANGRILFLFIAILIVGLCSAAGAYLLPKQADVPTAPTVNLQQQATTVATPLAKVVTQHGFDSAKQIVSALLASNEHLGAYLYVNTGMGQPNLVFQQSAGEQIIALNREESYNKDTMQVYHMPLRLDEQNVGELILTYTPPRCYYIIRRSIHCLYTARCRYYLRLDDCCNCGSSAFWRIK